MTDLRDWLKAHNIKNSMGGEMSYNTIQRMLSNRRYIGELRLRDVVQPNAIPALVSGELVGARPLHLLLWSGQKIQWQGRRNFQPRFRGWLHIN